MRVVLHVLLAVLFLTQPAAAFEGQVTIRYYGQAFFTLTTPSGLRIAIDPYGEIGYPLPTVEGDVVLITHEHRDHNNAGLIRGATKVLRALTPDGRDYVNLYTRVGDALVYSVASFHDNDSGAARGLNGIFVIETAGVRFAHLGDMGQHALSDNQVRAIGRVDVLMVPVGGAPFTIGAREATQIVARLQPRIVIPMHYKTAVRPDWPGTDERPFLEGKAGVRRLGSHTLTVSRERLPSSTEIVVMDYR